MDINKTAVITGGSKGIGKALVLKFLDSGYNVITCSRKEENLKALKKEAEQLLFNDDNLTTFICDLSDKEDTKRFVELVNENTSKIDVLVNNTGLYVPGQIQDEEEDAFESQISTNLFSAYRVTKGVIKKFVEQKSGDIFNICSTASIMPYVNGGSYCISKYALYGMSKVLREEMKEHGVRVVSVLPGATLTSSWEGVDLPPERFIPPEDIAKTIYEIHKLSDRTVVEEILIRPQLGDIV